MTRGGKREGAGRPAGTTKEPTVMLQRRVKPEWIPLIDKFIKDLRAKKALLILFCMFALALPCFALTLEATVEYTEETARVEAFEGADRFLTFKNIEQYNRSYFVTGIDFNNVLKVYNYKVSFMLKPMKVTGIIYKDEPNKLYGYMKKNNGYECVGIRVTEGNKYPMKTRNYYPKTGELISVGLLTETEEYKYDKNGKLIGYWNGNNGKLNKNIKMPLKMQLLSVLDNGS